MMVTVTLVLGGGTVVAGDAESMPAFAVVNNAWQRHFAVTEEFKKGDLITRDQVKPLLAEIESLGWNIADRQDILSRALSAKEFLVTELRGSKKGLAFMRAVSGLPHAYDRLDHLVRIPRGKQTVHDLIHKVGGAELIQYLTTTEGGKSLGKMLAETPNGRDFNKPTGRIYTADQLLDQLEASYKRAIAPPPESSAAQQSQ